jgi:hypothetical protein
MKAKLNKFFNKNSVAVAVAMLFLLSSFWLPVKISGTYKFEPDYGTLIVVLSNPPLTKDSMLSFWDENAETFKKMVIDNKGYNSILFIKDKFNEEAKLEGDKGSQFCLPKQIKGTKHCFYFEARLLSVDFEKIENESMLNLMFGDAYSYKEGICQLYIKETGEKKTYRCGT